jgi:hypothetical protein
VVDRNASEVIDGQYLLATHAVVRCGAAAISSSNTLAKAGLD